MYKINKYLDKHNTNMVTNNNNNKLYIISFYLKEVNFEVLLSLCY